MNPASVTQGPLHGDWPASTFNLPPVFRDTPHHMVLLAKKKIQTPRLPVIHPELDWIGTKVGSNMFYFLEIWIQRH